MDNQDNLKDINLKIINLIAEQLNIEPAYITCESSFNSLGADSLDQIEILMKVEDLFNLEIHDAQAEKIISVQNLIDSVNSLI